MWRFYQNELLPKSQQSVFGDFPQEMIPETLKQRMISASPSKKCTKMAE